MLSIIFYPPFVWEHLKKKCLFFFGYFSRYPKGKIKIKKKKQTRSSSLVKLEVMGFTKIKPKFSNPTFYTCPCSNKTHGLGLYFTNN
jgi:hypothetical protein